MKFLITGSSGFIGTHLVSRLEDDGNEVFKIDSTNEGVLDLNNFKKFKKHQIEVIIHLAGQTFVPDSWKKPADYLKNNLIGTINTIEFCRNSEAKFIYVSSYMYGSPDYLPIDELHPIKALNPYGLSKCLSEEVCEFYRDNYSLDVVIVRPFNIYGPGQKTDFLVPLILDQLINGVEVSVKDLGPKRDYLFIADFIDALICLSRKEIKSGIYNLGSGVSYSVKEVIDAAQLILETGHKVFETEERRGNEVMNVVADIGAIAERCDWKPQWGIEAGLAACIDKVKTDLLLK
jgi:GDP-4-dehydro-6-deoxy-D-mannose reductase